MRRNSVVASFFLIRVMKHLPCEGVRMDKNHWFQFINISIDFVIIRMTYIHQFVRGLIAAGVESKMVAASVFNYLQRIPCETY